MEKLTHLDEKTGAASMVDVSAKPAVPREAIASGRIQLQADTIALVRDDKIKKGSVLGIARIAGIQAAKQTQNLIPLCHQIPLSHASVEFDIQCDHIHIRATCRTTAQTGVEMEALTAVTVAALTIYDMCKAVDKTMSIDSVTLESKTKGEPNTQ